MLAFFLSSEFYKERKEKLFTQNNHDSEVSFVWENLKMFKIIFSILAFLTISHLQVELRI